MTDLPQVYISDEADGFTITINGNVWHFEDGDTRERLLDVFDELEIESMYESVF